MNHISSSSSSHDSRILKELVLCSSLDSTSTDFNSSSYSSKEECDTIMSDELDRDQHDLFIKEYFHQQYLIMQDLYPSSFKSKQKTNEQLKTKINKQLSYSTSTDATERPITAFLVTCYGQQDQQQQKKNENNPSPENNFSAEKKRKFFSVQKLLTKFESWGRSFLLG